MEPHKGLTILFEYCLLSLVLCNTILVIDQVHIEEWVCMDVQAIKKAENGFWEVCSQEDCTILSPNSHALFSRIVPLCAAGSRLVCSSFRVLSHILLNFMFLTFRLCQTCLIHIMSLKSHTIQGRKEPAVKFSSLFSL